MALHSIKTQFPEVFSLAGESGDDPQPATLPYIPLLEYEMFLDQQLKKRMEHLCANIKVSFQL